VELKPLLLLGHRCAQGKSFSCCEGGKRQKHFHKIGTNWSLFLDAAAKKRMKSLCVCDRANIMNNSTHTKHGNLIISEART